MRGGFRSISPHWGKGHKSEGWVGVGFDNRQMSTKELVFHNSQRNFEKMWRLINAVQIIPESYGIRENFNLNFSSLRLASHAVVFRRSSRRSEKIYLFTAEIQAKKMYVY